MRIRGLALCFAAVCSAAAQNYTGPRPPQPDLPYLKHAENLVPTEALEAKEEKGKKPEKKEKKGEKGEAGQEPTHSGPSLGEVRTYIQEKGLSVDPVIFFNHYEAKGWAGIKSWKALLEKWEAQDAKKREEKESPQYREAKENRRRELEEANHD